MNTRGQAGLVGFILLFGFLILTLSLYQAYIIPNQNAEVEFNHYEQVRNDMMSVYTDVGTLGLSSQNGQVTVPISTGTTYPSRIVGINPPPVAGTIESTASGTMYINGSADRATRLCGGNRTTGIRYNTAYHELGLPSVTYENGILYGTDGAGTTIVLENRTFIDNSTKTINLYRLIGSFRSRGDVSSVPVELTGTDTYGDPEQEWSIDDNGGITVPSNLPPSEWNSKILPAGLTATPNGSSVDINGFQGDPYTVRCFSVGLGKKPNTSFAYNKSFN